MKEESSRRKKRSTANSIASSATSAQDAIADALAGRDVFSTASRAAASPNSLANALAGRDPYSTTGSLLGPQGSIANTLAGRDPYSTTGSLLGPQGSIANALAGRDPYSTTPATPTQNAIADALAASYIPTSGFAPPKSKNLRPGASIAAAGTSSISTLQRDNADPISHPADLGGLVRIARKAVGLNQQEFADLAGVGRRFVSELESGKATLEFGKVLRCCAAAGIDLFATRRQVA
jgi:y4mF family transcriptional regulator